MNVNFTLRNMPRDPEKTKPSVFAASVLFFIGVAGLYVLPRIMLLIELVFGEFLIPELSGMIQSMYYIVFIVLPIFVYAKRDMSSCADVMRINPLSVKSALLCTVSALICVYLSQIVTVLWSILIETVIDTPPDSNFIIPVTTKELALSIFFAAILPGVCEELLFRGAILGAWEEKGSVKAIAISSIWFMLMHGTLTGIPAQLICGVILGIIVVSTDSLFGGMIFHTVYNAATIILAFVLNQQTQPKSEITLTIFESIGGMSGILSLLLPTAFFSILLFLTIKAIDSERLRKKGFVFGYPPAEARDLTLAEYMVMGAGFSIVFMNYISDLLSIMGWI
ncbi:MAG: CPBP family intramembrane metalloprotease [Clostridia bacterium]|nr:CPBP family intramembrane metalloprotease [Clostridia bacterium]